MAGSLTLQAEVQGCIVAYAHADFGVYRDLTQFDLAAEEHRWIGILLVVLTMTTTTLPGWAAAIQIAPRGPSRRGCLAFRVPPALQVALLKRLLSHWPRFRS